MTLGSFKFVLAATFVTFSSSIANAQEDKFLGTRKNPIKLAMVPSSDSSKILSNMKPVAQCLEKESGYIFEISVPNNYVVVIESLGSKKTDAAFLPTFAYVMAHERYGVEALLKSSRQGDTTYRGELIVKADSKINKLEDLAGKKIAYVDPASTAGYILPKKLLSDHKIKTGEEVFAGKHDVVVTMVYQGQVDAGAGYYNTPTADGKMRDARERVLTQFPDVASKIKIIALTDEIPNDPIVVRKDLSPGMKTKIVSAFEKCIILHTDAFKGINNSDGLVAVSDADYDGLRKTIKDLKIDLGVALNKKQ